MANELTEAEKNEKLLRIAGFTPHIGSWSGDKDTVVSWWYPDGISYGTAPDLLHSLDAQEKYLVPVLRNRYGEIRIIYTDWLAASTICVNCSIEYRTGVYSWQLLTENTYDDNLTKEKSQAFAEACLKLEGEGK